MNRHEAAKAGERFFTSKPCKRDGDTQRYTAAGQCVTCSKRRSSQHAKTLREAIQAGKAAPSG